MSDDSPIPTDYLDRIAADLEGLVDEKTDQDLELKRVFRLLDSTRTLPGQAVLYAWVRSQCLTPAVLGERIRRIQSWKNAECVEQVRKILKQCGNQSYRSVVQDIWRPEATPGRGFRVLLYLWLVIACCAFVSPIIFGVSGLLFGLLPVAVINVAIHSRWHRRIARHYFSIAYLARLLTCSRRLCGNLPPDLSAEEDELRRLAKRTQQLGKYTSLFINPTHAVTDLVDSFLEYVRVFLLAELVSYLVLYRLIALLQPELKRIFEIVGAVDASLAVFEFAIGDKRVCIPELMEHGDHLSFEDLVHPLIPGCVGNTASFTRGVILTGANMAGKSTFLRTLGINQVLATTLGLAFGKRFTTTYRRLATSLQTMDSLEQNKSHYYAEAQRLHALWMMGKAEPRRWLLLVDEVLSGTNSADRNRAVTAIMTDLSRERTFIVVTTHELNIARQLAETYDNYHFTEKIEGSQVVFDYTLHEGIVDRSNALRLLCSVGFPEELF